MGNAQRGRLRHAPLATILQPLATRSGVEDFSVDLSPELTETANADWHFQKSTCCLFIRESVERPLAQTASVLRRRKPQPFRTLPSSASHPPPSLPRIKCRGLGSDPLTRLATSALSVNDGSGDIRMGANLCSLEKSSDGVDGPSGVPFPTEPYGTRCPARAPSTPSEPKGNPPYVSAYGGYPCLSATAEVGHARPDRRRPTMLASTNFGHRATTPVVDQVANACLSNRAT